MNSERLDQLLDFLKDDPNDAFTIYAIATEYNASDPEKALEYYEKLLSQHADYLATYYHAAILYADLGKSEQAETTFKKGIALAQNKNESLALRELQNAYNEFLFED
jgi:tetratricopeptide (TPR) repeat protein